MNAPPPPSLAQCTLGASPQTGSGRVTARGCLSPALSLPPGQLLGKPHADSGLRKAQVGSGASRPSPLGQSGHRQGVKGAPPCPVGVLSRECAGPGEPLPPHIRGGEIALPPSAWFLNTDRALRGSREQRCSSGGPRSREARGAGLGWGEQLGLWSGREQPVWAV